MAALLLGGCTPEAGPIECGGGGSYHDSGDLGRHCAYIVIVGGFRCPEELPYRWDFPTGEVVCSDRPIASEEELPEEVCAAVGRDCATGRRSEQCNWDQTFGGSDRTAPAPDGEWLGRFAAVAVGADGTVYVAATLNRDADLGAGVRSVPTGQATALVAFDGLGRHRWDRVFPDAWVPSIAATPAGVVLTGAFEGSVDFGGGARSAGGAPALFVVALDGDGDHRWDRTVPLAGDPAPALPVIDFPQRVAVASDGGVRVVGGFATGADFGGGPRTAAGMVDGFVLALDAAGNHLWDQAFGGAGVGLNLSRITRDATDRLYLAGGFDGAVDFGGGERTSRAQDAFVLALDAGGAYRWDRQISGRFCDVGGMGPCPIDAVGGVAVLRDGALVVTGSYADGADFGGGVRAHGSDQPAIFIASYDADGGYLWDDVSLPVGGLGAAATAYGDGVAIVGTFSRLTDFGGGARSTTDFLDGFALGLSAAGDYLFDETFVGMGIGFAGAVAPTPAGNLIVGGLFDGAADLGHGERTAEGLDAFATRICP